MYLNVGIRNPQHSIGTKNSAIPTERKTTPLKTEYKFR
jgi:hypothetical protein